MWLGSDHGFDDLQAGQSKTASSGYFRGLPFVLVQPFPQQEIVGTDIAVLNCQSS